MKGQLFKQSNLLILKKSLSLGEKKLKGFLILRVQSICIMNLLSIDRKGDFFLQHLPLAESMFFLEQVYKSSVPLLILLFHPEWLDMSQPAPFYTERLFYRNRLDICV